MCYSVREPRADVLEISVRWEGGGVCFALFLGSRLVFFGTAVVLLEFRARNVDLSTCKKLFFSSSSTLVFFLVYQRAPIGPPSPPNGAHPRSCVNNFTRVLCFLLVVHILGTMPARRNMFLGRLFIRSDICQKLSSSIHLIPISPHSLASCCCKPVQNIPTTLPNARTRIIFTSVMLVSLFLFAWTLLVNRVAMLHLVWTATRTHTFSGFRFSSVSRWPQSDQGKTLSILYNFHKNRRYRLARFLLRLSH